MSSRYRSYNIRPFHDSMHYFLNPNELHNEEVMSELQRDYGPKHDPDKAPPPVRGDKYIIIASITGVVLGGIVAGVISFAVGWSFYAIVIGGVVIGGILGLVIGNRIKKRILSKEPLKK